MRTRCYAAHTGNCTLGEGTKIKNLGLIKKKSSYVHIALQEGEKSLFPSVYKFFLQRILSFLSLGM